MANLSNINNKFLVTTGGNVLINKTAASNATVGTQIMNTGDVNATVSGDTVARFNRLSSDGEIIRFQNDTATDGAINCLSGRIAIGSSNTGIFFDSIRQVITPWDITDNDNEFNNISFGRSIVRFKDIYLSGKVVAGTGSTDAATINAFSTTVSAGLHSALRIIENTGASSYWDIGATNGASTILNFYHNANTTPKITFTHLGGATFAGDVGIGTTSPNSYSNQTVLTINGTTYGRLDLESGGTLRSSLFSQAANTTLAVSTGFFSIDVGSERLRIDTSGNVGIGTTTPYARLNSYGAIISQTADNDPEVTLTNTGGWGVQSGGTIRVMQGFSRSGVAGDAIVFTYAATSWKSWSLDYIFSSTQGISQGTVGGYWNNSGTDSNVENIDNLQVSVAVTHGGTGNQNNIITFTFNAPGTHINCSFVYTQSGGDGAPRGDRVTIETISNTP